MPMVPGPWVHGYRANHGTSPWPLRGLGSHAWGHGGESTTSMALAMLRYAAGVHTGAGGCSLPCSSRLAGTNTGRRALQTMTAIACAAGRCGDRLSSLGPTLHFQHIYSDIYIYKSTSKCFPQRSWEVFCSCGTRMQKGGAMTRRRMLGACRGRRSKEEEEYG